MPDESTPQEFLRIDVHLIDASSVSCAQNRFTDTLNREERQRARRFHRERDAERWRHIRSRVKDILSIYTAIPPADIRFGTESRGKPYIEDVSGPLQIAFNLSHSGDLAALAITAGKRIGIDIEQKRPLTDMDQLVDRFFSRKEQHAYWSRPPETRELAFFTGWTRKEAVLKVEGQGLSLPLHAFDVSLDSSVEFHFPRLRPPIASHPPYLVMNLNTITGYAGAVAVRMGRSDTNPPPRLCVHHDRISLCTTKAQSAI